MTEAVAAIVLLFAVSNIVSAQFVGYSSISTIANAWVACPSYSSSLDTLSASQNVFGCAMTLCQGEVVTFSMCGSCSADTYLRLYNSFGGLVAVNDDGCGTLCSNLQVTIPTA
eukprot:gene37509-45555_t